jgi:L-malate glycosyltransferase
MRILLVVNSVNFGGAERQAIELAKGLARRHHVEFATLSKPEGGLADAVEALGIPCHSFPRTARHDLRPVAALARLICREHIDVVQGFMAMGSLFGALAARLSRRPCVCSAIRDGRPKNRREVAVTRTLSLIGNALVANSMAGLRSRFPKPMAHHLVIYNGVDFTRLETTASATPDWLKEVHPERFQQRVGIIASLSINRDHATLLKAARTVVTALPQTLFLIVGDGSQRPLLERMAENLGLTGNVAFTGYRTDSDLVYRSLDVAVLLTNTDEVDEGTSNALIEAMGAGLPVVATRSGATPEVVTSETHGILVAPKSSEETASAIMRLLTNPALANRMGMEGSSHVRRLFAHQRYIAEYEVLYRGLLKNS